jgi:hypothetical protein
VYSRACAAPAGLSIITVRRGPRLIGLLPVYVQWIGSPLLRLRRLGFISTGETESDEVAPDYLDLLHVPGEERACLGALASLLSDQGRLRWDVLDLLDVSHRSPLLAIGSGLGERVDARVIDRGVCPIADLGGGFEAYLQRLSHKTRQHARQYLRAADKAAAVFELASTPAEIESIFADFVRLHQARWAAAGKPGCFASERFTSFHRAIASRWVPHRKALLARLSVAGQPVATVYGFRTGARFDFYQSGTLLDDKSLPITSPGTTILLLLMRHLAEDGVTSFDFLRGSSSYKQRLATDQHPLKRLQVVRPSVLCTTYSVGDLVRRASMKGLRVLRGGIVQFRGPAPRERRGAGEPSN